MIKKILSSSGVQWILASIAAFYIWILWITTRWTFLGEDTPNTLVQNNQGFITCFWHNRLFMLGPTWKRRHDAFHMLISAHKDGALISKAVSFFGIKTIAGSTNKAGGKALKDMVRCLKNNGVVGITPDGPRGPREKVTLGLIQTAYLSQTPIVLITYACRRGKTFSSWDRFFLPHPFNRGVVAWSTPILPPKTKNEFEEKRQAVERALLTLQRTAEEAL